MTDETNATSQTDATNTGDVSVWDALRAGTCADGQAGIESLALQLDSATATLVKPDGAKTLSQAEKTKQMAAALFPAGTHLSTVAVHLMDVIASTTAGDTSPVIKSWEVDGSQDRDRGHRVCKAVVEVELALVEATRARQERRIGKNAVSQAVAAFKAARSALEAVVAVLPAGFDVRGAAWDQVSATFTEGIVKLAKAQVKSDPATAVEADAAADAAAIATEQDASL